MFGIRLMFLLAVMGGIIAFIADKMGSKIGKKKLSVFGLFLRKAPARRCSAWKNCKKNCPGLRQRKPRQKKSMIRQ